MRGTGEGLVTTELVALDVGGTHARFALASIGADGAIAVGEPVTLKTSDYATISSGSTG